MKTKIRGLVLLYAMLPIFCNAQVSRIVSFTRDGVLTWTNQPAKVYYGLLIARAVDDVWLPAGNPWWNVMTSNSTTTLQLPTQMTPMAQLFLRLICSTNPVSIHATNVQVPAANITVDGQV